MRNCSFLKKLILQQANKMASKKYALSINHDGEDYQVEVDDIHTANLLLNDAEAAYQYMEAVLGDAKNSCNKSDAEMETNHESAEGSDIEDIQNVPSTSGQNDCIWTKKKPTEMDLEATSLLISLREKDEKLFDDKKTRKAKLWNNIAKIMESNFHLGPNRGERCRQKFANLQKSYIAYVKHQTTTGTEKYDDIPPFFDRLHSILGSKHKVNPKKLEDSLDPESINVGKSDDDNNQDIQDQKPKKDRAVLQENNPNLTSTPKTTEKPYSDRFKTIHRKVTPSKQEELLKEIREDRKNRNEEFAFLKQHLIKSEKQKDRFLAILEKAFSTKKRKNVNSSSDSE